MLWAALSAKALKIAFLRIPPLMRIGLVIAGVLGFAPTLISLYNRLVSAGEDSSYKPRRRWTPSPLPAPPSCRPFDVRNQVRGAPDNRRQSLRRNGNPVDVLVAETKGQEVEGVVVDRSTGGLCLSLPHAVNAQTVLRVIARHAPEDSPWLIVKVRHCRQAENRWLCGCQFMESPPWSQLLLFG
jgi:hypothetical protein